MRNHIFAARTLDYSPEEKNKSYDGYPEAPSEFDLIDKAVKLSVTDMRRMFLPWSDETELVYYDDKECGLKQAFETLKSGDVEGAARLSEANVGSCKATAGVKDKVLGHAYYNAAMSRMMHDDYDGAQAYFLEAGKLRPGDIVEKAAADCQKARELMTAMQPQDQGLEVRLRHLLRSPRRPDESRSQRAGDHRDDGAVAPRHVLIVVGTIPRILLLQALFHAA